MVRSPEEHRAVAEAICKAIGLPFVTQPGGSLPMVDAAAMFVAAIDALTDYRVLHPEEKPK